MYSHETLWGQTMLRLSLVLIIVILIVVVAILLRLERLLDSELASLCGRVEAVDYRLLAGQRRGFTNCSS